MEHAREDGESGVRRDVVERRRQSFTPGLLAGASGPAGLWPLVALTSDGATEEALRQAVAAIEARADLDPGHRADHLAVLWFVAEAEQVPVRAMMVYLSEEKLTESALY